MKMRRARMLGKVKNWLQKTATTTTSECAQKIQNANVCAFCVYSVISVVAFYGCSLSQKLP